MIKRNRIEQLLDIIYYGEFSKFNEAHRKIVTWYTWLGIRTHATYQSLACFVMICMTIGLYFDDKAGKDRQLPVDAWFYVNSTVSPNFEIISSYQCISITLGAIHNIAMDSLITHMMTTACCQLQILSYNLITHEEGAKTDTMDLEDCIYHHNYVIKYTKKYSNNTRVIKFSCLFNLIKF